jgi:ribosomal protein S18 acetylase RimI-like enzyme
MLQTPKTQSDLSHAIDAFVRGYCSGRSRTHPYEWAEIDGVWVMRDAPRRNPRDYRKEEWIACGVEPAAADRTARGHTRGRYFVCAVHGADESDQPLRAAYKQLGYRLLVAEPFFLHRLKRIPRTPAPVVIKQVRTTTLAEQFAKATRTRPIPPEHLSPDAPFRQYVALDEGKIVGWVRSVAAGDAARWCSDMYVRPSHRRRGIGSALLGKMLRDDRKHGARRSVLLSSRTGALVYPRVGYEQIGGLLIFAPRKR